MPQMLHRFDFTLDSLVLFCVEVKFQRDLIAASRAVWEANSLGVINNPLSTYSKLRPQHIPSPEARFNFLRGERIGRCHSLVAGSNRFVGFNAIKCSRRLGCSVSKSFCGTFRYSHFVPVSCVAFAHHWVAATSLCATSPVSAPFVSSSQRVPFLFTATKSG